METKTQTQTQSATLRYLRMAPRKVRAVAELMKGLSVNEAEAQLLLEPRRAAKPLLKLLRSAVANAKATKRMDADKLVIESVRVDGGPMLKRSLPRARGMATPIQKKMSHVLLLISEKPEAKSRFKIVVKKKIKLPPEDRPKPKKTIAKPERETRENRKPGFWRRMFARKSV